MCKTSKCSAFGYLSLMAQFLHRVWRNIRICGERQFKQLPRLSISNPRMSIWLQFKAFRLLWELCLFLDLFVLSTVFCPFPSIAVYNV